MKNLFVISTFFSTLLCTTAVAFAQTPTSVPTPTPTPLPQVTCNGGDFQTPSYVDPTSSSPYFDLAKQYRYPSRDYDFVKRLADTAYYYTNPFQTAIRSDSYRGDPTSNDSLDNGDIKYYNPDLFFRNPAQYKTTYQVTEASVTRTCAINQSCIGTDTFKGLPQKGVNYKNAVSSNQGPGCYQWCQCGILAGNIEVHYNSYNDKSQKKEYFYENTLFYPTKGGEVSNVFKSSGEVYPYFNSSTEYTYGTGKEVSVSSDFPYTPLTETRNDYTNCHNQSDGTLWCDSQGDGSAHHIVGISGYFCGSATNSWYAQSGDTTTSVHASDNIADQENNFQQLYPAPQDQQVAIGASDNSYYSRRFGHGMDMKQNPTIPLSSILALTPTPSTTPPTPTGSTVTPTPSPDPAALQVPTVCMNLSWQGNGENGNAGIVKFVPVHGGNDCRQETINGNNNYFSCVFDNNKTIRECPTGSHYDGTVQWGWPCVQDQGDTGTNKFGTSSKHTPSAIQYADAPYIYPNDTTVSDLSNQIFANSTRCDNTDYCDTAIGRISTNTVNFVGSIMQYVLGFGGATALILIIFGGYQLIMSQGNPDKVKEARERITSAIIGLLFMIFSAVFLQVLGVDILHLPGLGK